MADHSGLDGLGGNDGTGRVLVGSGKLAGTGADPGSSGVHGGRTDRDIHAREVKIVESHEELRKIMDQLAEWQQRHGGQYVTVSVIDGYGMANSMDGHGKPWHSLSREYQIKETGEREVRTT